MGVPKFFRWISERYPNLSELVKNYQIPEFDNLYLDMNGIIHVCSHPNDFDPHFRITEERIFQDIFNYIETLFKMIQPRKLFFMAVDGVAPRAKMNQQRGRRFRSAKEAEVLEKKARDKGEQLPDEARFDSNCITPGTAFMARLQEQLKYFVANKVSTDPLWSTIRVILSGHNTPGEGEHKIMDFIRYMKSQPDYDPNTRHCLYGLDADLIMLGMCTHEPYFCLLREEVKFGKRNQQHRMNSAENINFYLLHLSLLRDYLSLEFQPLKEKIDFSWDLERIIDDWVLMGFLVGNDFIPPLPHMHIASGALPMLYKAYIEILPTLGGYIQESGYLNLRRFEGYLQFLSKFDVEHFKDVQGDLKYMEFKTGRKRDTPRNIRDEDLNELINSTMEILSDTSDVSSNDEDFDDRLFREQFFVHKADYYVNKMEFESMTPELLKDQTRVYVEAIQWNLHYYYHGVCSWSWFYPHHYAPYVSDIRDFADLELHYDLGKPFRPFEQLLAVLPAASRELLPEPYQKLMTEENSPIIDYYPSDFKTDLNGKQQQWEAVVLIPFIEEDALLNAMRPHEDKLTEEENFRNSEGPMLEYRRDPEVQGIVKAPEYFPPVNPSFAKLTPISREQLFVPRDKLVKGLCPGINLEIFSPGFPTLRHIAHTARLEKAKVKVFNQASRGDNMITEVKQTTSTLSLPDAAKRLLGKSVWVGWPHLQEALVTAVADANDMVAEIPRNFSQKEWLLHRQNLREDYMNKQGIDLGEVRILVYARPMIGRRYMIGQRGRITIEKQWTSSNVVYPLQVVIPEVPVRAKEIQEYASLQQLFPVGTTVFLLCPEVYGAQGEVLSTKEKFKIFVQANLPSSPNLDSVREIQKRYLDSFVTGQEAARRVGTTPFLLSRLTGTIYAQSDADKKTNLGLNLKFNRRNEEVVGFTRKENNSAWLYSQECVKICKEYVDKFPEVVKCLAAHSSDDVLAENEVFENRERLLDAVSWLKGLSCSFADRVTCGTELLSPDAVKELERIIDDKEAEWRKRPSVLRRVHVQPIQVFRPELQMGQVPPDPTAQYRLLDRVNLVGLKFGSTIGQFGTVIAVRRNENTTLCDLVLDNGIRCISLPSWSMINLSYGRRLIQPVSIQAQTHSSPWNNAGPSPANRKTPSLSSNAPPSIAGNMANAMHLHAPPQPAFQLLQRPHPHTHPNHAAAQSTVVLRQLLKIGNPSTTISNSHTSPHGPNNIINNSNSSGMIASKPRPRLNLPPPPPQQWVQTRGEQRPRPVFHPHNLKGPAPPSEARFVPLQAIRAQQRKRDNAQTNPAHPHPPMHPLHLIRAEAAPSCAPISLAATHMTSTSNTSASTSSKIQTSATTSPSTSTVAQVTQKQKVQHPYPTQQTFVHQRRPRIAAKFAHKFVD